MGEAVQADVVGSAVQPRMDLGQAVRLAGLEKPSLESLEDVLRHEVSRQTAHCDDCA